MNLDIKMCDQMGPLCYKSGPSAHARANNTPARTPFVLLRNTH